MQTLKRILLGLAGLVVLLVLSASAYAFVQARSFDASMEKVYGVPVPRMTRSDDPAVIARGKHLAEAFTSCATPDCHGADGGGGKVKSFGPIGTLAGPNITSGGLGAAYTDGELFRLIRHGIKKDGRSLRFMPAQDFCWLPDSDVVALVSYVRSLPAVDRPNGPVHLGFLAKVLDRAGKIPIDVAGHIDHAAAGTGPAPEPTPRYGALLSRVCTGCHGAHLSGGRIPGAPSSLPVPSNLTPHDTGLKGWTYEDFVRVLEAGIKKNGQKVDPFMPTTSFGKLDDTEKRALWAYLASLPPTELGNR
jgi:mono/diheme cytochrome c family protein